MATLDMCRLMSCWGANEPGVFRMWPGNCNYVFLRSDMGVYIYIYTYVYLHAKIYICNYMYMYIYINK